MQVERVDDRRIVLKFARGDRVKEFPLDVPAVIYRGVYAEDTAYELGDTVTWAGALWHANQATATKPGAGNKAWTLCTKAGRDGRDGKDGAKGDRGPPGPPGKDLTQLGPDGAKW